MKCSDSCSSQYAEYVLKHINTTFAGGYWLQKLRVGAECEDFYCELLTLALDLIWQHTKFYDSDAQVVTKAKCNLLPFIKQDSNSVQVLIKKVSNRPFNAVISI